MPDRLLGLLDSEIVSSIRNGDEVLFEKLFRAYYHPLGAFARTYVYIDDQAEEIVCEVFTTLWARRERFHTTGTVQSYLYAAVRNRALNYKRDRSRADARIENLIALETSPGHSSTPESVETQLVHEDARRAVVQSWSRLNQQQREVLTLRYFRSMGFDEIASILGVSRQAAEKQVSRAIQALRVGLPPGFP